MIAILHGDTVLAVLADTATIDLAAGTASDAGMSVSGLAAGVEVLYGVAVVAGCSSPTTRADLVVSTATGAAEAAARHTLYRAAGAIGLSPAWPGNDAAWGMLAEAVVDAQAGQAREAIGTPGYGQETEYRDTETDARAYLAAVAADPNAAVTSYKFFGAELAARASAGLAATAQAVAEEIVTQADAWKSALAAIKEVRRTAKLKIDAAADVATMAGIVSGLVWPKA